MYQCVLDNTPDLRGLKTEDFFVKKIPQNLALVLAKNGLKSDSRFKKMAQKIRLAKNGGERKINPSANPEINLI